MSSRKEARPNFKIPVPGSRIALFVFNDDGKPYKHVNASKRKLVENKADQKPWHFGHWVHGIVERVVEYTEELVTLESLVYDAHFHPQKALRRCDTLNVAYFGNFGMNEREQMGNWWVMTPTQYQAAVGTLNVKTLDAINGESPLATAFILTQEPVDPSLKCEVCKFDHSEKNMGALLICDGAGCGKGYHEVCAGYKLCDPELPSKKPEDVKWFCDGCMSGSRPPRERKPVDYKEPKVPEEEAKPKYVLGTEKESPVRVIADPPAASNAPPAKKRKREAKVVKEPPTQLIDDKPKKAIPLGYQRMAAAILENKKQPEEAPKEVEKCDNCKRSLPLSPFENKNLCNQCIKFNGRFRRPL